jgi:hypothetical protein
MFSVKEKQCLSLVILVTVLVSAHFAEERAKNRGRRHVSTALGRACVLLATEQDRFPTVVHHRTRRSHYFC